MKKTLRLAVGVAGFVGLSLAGSVLSSSVPVVTPGVIAGALAQSPPPQIALPAPRAQRGIVDDPVAKRHRPKLRTVRTRFDALIESVASHHEVEPALVKAIVQAESSFNPNAVSRAGARGLMQVLPETASIFSVENLLDPQQNLQAGVQYLKHLIELFDGNVTMAVAAYNAGPSRVRRHRGVPPYNETRNYLTKVMGLRVAYADQLQDS